MSHPLTCPESWAYEAPVPDTSKYDGSGYDGSESDAIDPDATESDATDSNAAESDVGKRPPILITSTARCIRSRMTSCNRIGLSLPGGGQNLEYHAVKMLALCFADAHCTNPPQGRAHSP